MIKTLAATTPIDFGQLSGFGPLGNVSDNGISTLTTVISSAIGIMTIVAFIWFVFNLLVGAVNVMMAQSDKQKLENARQKILHGIYGIVIIIGALSLISLIGMIFGIDILNIPKLFGLIGTLGGGSGGGGGHLIH
jgi:hypothetical protein